MNITEKLAVKELNPHLLCALCGGYYIDATTVVECLHTFCKSCIVRYLESSKFCPTCDVQVHKTDPFLSIKPDKILQNVVYKLIPGLYKREMCRRKRFYAQRSDKKPSSAEDGGCHRNQPYILPDDCISIALKPCQNIKYDQDDAIALHTRFFNCPATVTVSHLKKLLRAKFELPSRHPIQLFLREDEPLNDTYSLIDVAYIKQWSKSEPLHIFYKIYFSKKIKLESEIVEKKLNFEEILKNVNKSNNSVLESAKVKSERVCSVKNDKRPKKTLPYSRSRTLPLSSIAMKDTKVIQSNADNYKTIIAAPARSSSEIINLTIQSAESVVSGTHRFNYGLSVLPNATIVSNILPGSIFDPTKINNAIVPLGINLAPSFICTPIAEQLNIPNVTLWPLANLDTSTVVHSIPQQPISSVLQMDYLKAQQPVTLPKVRGKKPKRIQPKRDSKERQDKEVQLMISETGLMMVSGGDNQLEGVVNPVVQTEAHELLNRIENSALLPSIPDIASDDSNKSDISDGANKLEQIKQEISTILKNLNTEMNQPSEVTCEAYHEPSLGSLSSPSKEVVDTEKSIIVCKSKESHDVVNVNNNNLPFEHSKNIIIKADIDKISLPNGKEHAPVAKQTREKSELEKVSGNNQATVKKTLNDKVESKNADAVKVTEVKKTNEVAIKAGGSPKKINENSMVTKGNDNVKINNLSCTKGEASKRKYHPVGYKTLKKTPKVWNPSIPREKLQRKFVANNKPNKIFTARNKLVSTSSSSQGDSCTLNATSTTRGSQLTCGTSPINSTGGHNFEKAKRKNDIAFTPITEAKKPSSPLAQRPNDTENLESKMDAKKDKPKFHSSSGSKLDSLLRTPKLAGVKEQNPAFKSRDSKGCDEKLHNSKVPFSSISPVDSKTKDCVPTRSTVNAFSCLPYVGQTQALLETIASFTNAHYQARDQLLSNLNPLHNLISYSPLATNYGISALSSSGLTNALPNSLSLIQSLMHSASKSHTSTKEKRSLHQKVPAAILHPASGSVGVFPTSPSKGREENKSKHQFSIVSPLSAKVDPLSAKVAHSSDVSEVGKAKNVKCKKNASAKSNSDMIATLAKRDAVVISPPKMASPTSSTRKLNSNSVCDKVAPSSVVSNVSVGEENIKVCDSKHNQQLKEQIMKGHQQEISDKSYLPTDSVSINCYNNDSGISSKRHDLDQMHGLSSDSTPTGGLRSQEETSYLVENKSSFPPDDHVSSHSLNVDHVSSCSSNVDHVSSHSSDDLLDIANNACVDNTTSLLSGSSNDQGNNLNSISNCENANSFLTSSDLSEVCDDLPKNVNTDFADLNSVTLNLVTTATEVEETVNELVPCTNSQENSFEPVLSSVCTSTNVASVCLQPAKDMVMSQVDIDKNKTRPSEFSFEKDSNEGSNDKMDKGNFVDSSQPTSVQEVKATKDQNIETLQTSNINQRVTNNLVSDLSLDKTDQPLSSLLTSELPHSITSESSLDTSKIPSSDELNKILFSESDSRNITQVSTVNHAIPDHKLDESRTSNLSSKSSQAPNNDGCNGSSTDIFNSDSFSCNFAYQNTPKSSNASFVAPCVDHDLHRFPRCSSGLCSCENIETKLAVTESPSSASQVPNSYVVPFVTPYLSPYSSFPSQTVQLSPNTMNPELQGTSETQTTASDQVVTRNMIQDTCNTKVTTTAASVTYDSSTIFSNACSSFATISNSPGKKAGQSSLCYPNANSVQQLANKNSFTQSAEEYSSLALNPVGSASSFVDFTSGSMPKQSSQAAWEGCSLNPFILNSNAIGTANKGFGPNSYSCNQQNLYRNSESYSKESNVNENFMSPSETSCSKSSDGIPYGGSHKKNSESYTSICSGSQKYNPSLYNSNYNNNYMNFLSSSQSQATPSLSSLVSGAGYNFPLSNSKFSGGGQQYFDGQNGSYFSSSNFNVNCASNYQNCLNHDGSGGGGGGGASNMNSNLGNNFSGSFCNLPLSYYSNCSFSYNSYPYLYQGGDLFSNPAAASLMPSLSHRNNSSQSFNDLHFQSGLFPVMPFISPLSGNSSRGSAASSPMGMPLSVRPFSSANATYSQKMFPHNIPSAETPNPKSNKPKASEWSAGRSRKSNSTKSKKASSSSKPSTAGLSKKHKSVPNNSSICGK